MTSPFDGHQLPPLRIGINALGTTIGGGISVCQNLVREMAHQRPQHAFVLYYSVPEVATVAFPPNVELVSRHRCSSLLQRTVWEQFVLPGEINARRIDAILLLSGFCAFATDVPQVSVWQNLNIVSRLSLQRGFKSRMKLKLKRQAKRLSLRKASTNIFLSEDSVKMTRSWWDLSDVSLRVIHNGIDERHVEPGRASTSREHALLSVGHAYVHKNYENLIAAMALYRQRYADGLKLWIVGGADNARYFERLRSLVTQAGLEHIVEILGPRSPEEVADLYSRAKAYVVTSLLETFGLTTLEAMQYQLPVLASDATCFPEVCGNAALYCNPLAPASIADGILQIVYDEELRARLIANGLVRTQDFSWSKSAAAYLEAIESAAMSSARGAFSVQPEQ